MASVVQVEPGQVGVQKLFGKVNNNILESGLNVINPLGSGCYVRYQNRKLYYVGCT